MLVADDDEAVRFTVRDFLETAGHSVLEVRNGRECMEVLSRVDGIDLAVVDIIMPEMDGVDVMREVKRLHPKLPIVVMSGGGRARNLDLLEVAESLGADRVLAKPFTQEQLLAVLRGCLPAGNP